MSSTTAMPRTTRRTTSRTAVESYEKVNGNRDERTRNKRPTLPNSTVVANSGHNLLSVEVWELQYGHFDDVGDLI